MSEPDIVPLPREGEVFFDVRGEARSMRLSWYADSKVAVFSIWQGNLCTGTFRLPFVDLARMVQTLQSGPPAPAHQSPAQPGHGYSPTVAGYDSGPDADVGYRQDGRYGYGAPAHQDYAAGQGYATGQGYGGGQAYPGGQGYDSSQDYRTSQGYGRGQNYGTSHDYGNAQDYRSYDADPYQGDPYGPSEPYHGNEPYQPGQPPYHASEQYRAGEQYPGSEQLGQGEPYRPPRHGTDQPGHGLSDYPPPKRSADSESVPDTAMMRFPSVPARNGPAGRR
jgi:hypothetical protein